MTPLAERRTRRDMAAQRWKMVDDYLAGKSFNSICENAQVCWKGLMLSGA